MKKFKSLILIAAMIIGIFSLDVTNVKAATKVTTSDRMTMYAKVFDYVYYVNTYPDVVAAVGNNSQSLLLHYMSCGIKEGRSASVYFNQQSYAARYPDLAAAYGNNYDAYVKHYITSGVYEGRNASALDEYLTPENQAAVLSRLTSMVGSCTTVYNASVPRATNVELAASKINGTVVQPGKTFSYDKTVGPRTTANGFVEAPIYISGQHGVGIGGGICQVSSTLYTALITAGIPATERHEHSLPVAYLPEGYDATISSGAYDLKFKNTYDKPLHIYCSAKNGYLVIQLTLVDQ